MKDVAERAKVSSATVSRAIHYPEKVSEFTRMKVKQAIHELGYLSHTLLRPHKYEESRNILLILPDICDPFFSEVIRGAEATATKMGYQILISDCTHQSLITESIEQLLRTHQIDGILLADSQHSFLTDFSLQNHFIPVVVLNECGPKCRFPAIRIDNLTAAFEMVNYLIQLGHLRIACLCGPSERPLCYLRLQGYIQALRRNGLEVDPRYIIRSKLSFAGGQAAMEQLMGMTHLPQALFCHSDLIALGAISRARQVGLSVPEQISVTGFDDIEAASYSHTQLTTISLPRYRMGCEAMSLLGKQLRGESLSETPELLDFEMKIRGTTAVPSNTLHHPDSPLVKPSPLK